MFSWIKKYILEIFVLLLYLISLSIIYPKTVLGVGGDAYQYYGWIKDIYANHFGYLSWTTSAGYNLYSIIHIFSFLIGSFTYKSPIAFNLIVNYTELILFLFMTIFFIKLTKLEKLKTWIFILPPAIVTWTILSILTDPAVKQQLILQATDTYMFFVDSFIILHLGLFLNLLYNYQKNNKLPIKKLIGFILISLYFSLTTLRFLNGAILTEIAILIIFYIRGLTIKPLKLIKTTKNQSTNQIAQVLTIPNAPFILGTILIIIFIIGYYGFFMVEVFSSSARFVLRGGSLTTTEAWQNALTALSQYCSDFNTFPAIILRPCYLLTLFYAIITLPLILFKYQQIKLKQLFALLALINFTLVTMAGLFSHGTIFLDTPVIAHYYELSAIFSFLTITAFLVEQLENFNYRLTSAISLSICTIFSMTYLATHKVALPGTQLVSCINSKANQYNLKDGLGDWGATTTLMANPNNKQYYTLLGARATNLDYNWQSNLTLPQQNTNFLVYDNNDYKQRALYILNLKTPGVNYQDINCDDNSGFLVFDESSTNYINKVRQTEYTNSKAWFYLSSYGSGQNLWAKMPWNQSFINQYHEYNYYGSLLNRVSKNVQYTVNSDLSLTINGNEPQSPALMSEMIHAGAGKYYINANYSTNNGANLYIVNLNTKEPITSLSLASSDHNATLDFTLYETTPILLAIVLTPNTNLFTLQSITLGKYVP